MAETILQHAQHPLLIANLGIDHSLRVQADARQRQSQSEQVPLAKTPKHRPLHSREHASNEQRRGRATHSADPAAGHLVEGAQARAAGRQLRIQGIDTERKRTPETRARPLDSCDLRPERLQ